jgi:hypothetical protein
VTKRCEFAVQVMRANAGLHAHETRPHGTFFVIAADEEGLYSDDLSIEFHEQYRDAKSLEIFNKKNELCSRARRPIKMQPAASCRNRDTKVATSPICD